MSNNSSTTCSLEHIFEHDADMVIKFPLIGIFGSSVSIMGMFMNMLLTYTFLRNKEFRNSYMLYLGAISAGDMFRCASYFLIFAIEIYFNQFRQFHWMYVAWVYYTPHLFAVSRTAAMTVTYLLIAASTERYFAVKNPNYRSTVHVRAATIVIIVSTIILYCMPMYFSISWVENLNCSVSSYGRLRITPTALLSTWSYRTLYEIYFNNVLQVFLPFLTLLTLNFAIIVRLKSMLRLGNALFSRFAIGAEGVGRQQRNLRSATVTLIALITGYLIANIPSVVLKFIEQIIPHSSMDSTKLSFAVDSTTMLHIVYAAFRFMAYVCCNEKIRRELFAILSCSTRNRRTSEEQLKVSLVHQTNGSNLGENGMVVRVAQPERCESQVYLEML